MNNATPKILTFKRDDGAIYDCIEGDPSHQVFTRSDRFTAVSGDSTATKTSPDLKKMKKAELVAHAESIGVTVVPDDMTMKEIIAAIEAGPDTENQT